MEVIEMATATTDAACVGLTGFQRDVLASVARAGPECGRAIKTTLESTGYSDVNDARLYTNLDSLEEEGLITTEALDKRTNEYALTEDGKHELAAYHSRLTESLDDPTEDNETLLVRYAALFACNRCGAQMRIGLPVQADRVELDGGCRACETNRSVFNRVGEFTEVETDV